MSSVTLSSKRTRPFWASRSRPIPAATLGAADSTPLRSVPDAANRQPSTEGGSPIRQLVLHYAGAQHPMVDVVANASAQPPMSYEDRENDSFVPRLGSSQLLKVTDFLQEQGFVVNGFQLADGYMSPVPGGSISKALTKVMRQQGARRVSELLATDLNPYIVVAVEFLSPSMGTLTLKQNGVVVGTEVAQREGREALKKLLSVAWAQASFN